MPNRYRDIYPSDPEKRSADLLRTSAAQLLSAEYFIAEPASMPTQQFVEHHVLINLKAQSHRVENWRDGDYRDFQFHQYEVVVTPAGVESGWRWHEQSECIVITLDPSRLEDFAQRELGILLTSVQLKNIPQFLDEDISKAALMLIEALDAKIGSDVMFESFARIFLVKLIHKYGDEKTPDDPDFNASFSSEQYQAVLVFISENYGQDIRLEDMAEIAGMSASHFSRHFKQTIGESPHQFVMSYRVDQAQKRLMATEDSLIDVALGCGFSDQAHFTRVFRQRMDKTPKQWRNERRNS